MQVANLRERQPDVAAPDNQLKEWRKQVVSVPESLTEPAIESSVQRWPGMRGLLQQDLGLIRPVYTQPLQRFEVQRDVWWRVKEKVGPESLHEESLTGRLSRQDTAVDLYSYSHGSVLVANDVQLAYGALMVASKTEQLKEENTLAHIGWVRSHLLRQLLNSRYEMSGIEKLFGMHQALSSHSGSWLLTVLGRCGHNLHRQVQTLLNIDQVMLVIVHVFLNLLATLWGKTVA